MVDRPGLHVQLMGYLIHVVSDSSDLSQSTFPLTAVLAAGYLDGQSALNQEARHGEASGTCPGRYALMLVSSCAGKERLRVVNLSDGVTSRRSASKPDMNLSIHPAPR